MDHEISTDNKTIWVNGPVSMLGRFSRFGIDIHKPLDDQIKDGNECLHCTHSEPTEKDWQDFRAGMLEHFGIEIDESYRPEWVKP